MTTLNENRVAAKKTNPSFNDSNNESKSCPRCGSNKLQRAKAVAREGVVRALLYKFYRCRSCNFRFRKIKLSNLIVLASVLVVFFAILSTYWYNSGQAISSGEATEISAFKHISDEAMNGDSEAELLMGLRYAQADGVSKNDKEAVKWFEKAAQHNQVEAQYRLGRALLEGVGVVQNYQSAFYWLEKSALRGHALAQLSLGEIYRQGIGVAVNKEKAYLWFNLAAASGLEKAAYTRDLLARQLQPSQISAMQEEAQRINNTNLAKESESDAKK